MSVYSNSFRSKKLLGDQGEKHVLALYARAGISGAIRRRKCEQADIDAVLYERAFTTECKRDLMQAATGKLAIEFYNSRSAKVSGIDATTADLWVYVLDIGGQMTAWACRTKDLKRFVAMTVPERIICNAGDGNASIKLYAADVILPMVFRRIDDLHAHEFRELLAELLGDDLLEAHRACTKSK